MSGAMAVAFNLACIASGLFLFGYSCGQRAWRRIGRTEGVTDALRAYRDHGPDFGWWEKI